MAITSIFRPLFYSFGRVNAYVQAQVQKRMMHANNALYEAIFDAKTPKASSQTIQGHNHADTGGGAFPRGLSWSEDLGRANILADEFDVSNLVINLAVGNHCRYRVSENMDSARFLDGWILYSCKNSEVLMTVYEAFSGESKVASSETILSKTYEDPETTEAMSWVKLSIPLGEGSTNGVNIEFRAKNVEQDKPPSFKIHAWQWAEVSGKSYTLGGAKL